MEEKSVESSQCCNASFSVASVCVAYKSVEEPFLKHHSLTQHFALKEKSMICIQKCCASW